MRVRENEAAYGAMLGGDFRLGAPPGAEVARDDDGAFDGDAYALELFVVVGNAEVDVNERSGDVAVNRVGVVGRELLGFLIRCGILGSHGFLQLCGEARAAIHQLDEAILWRGKEHVEGFYVRVPAELLEPGGDPFRIVFVVRRADMMRARREALHVSAQVLRAGNRTELFFPLAFGARRFGGITVERLVVGHTGCERSEEHTSELQSRLHLVCRLLLEKKKKNVEHKRTHKQDRSSGTYIS